MPVERDLRSSIFQFISKGFAGNAKIKEPHPAAGMEREKAIDRTTPIIVIYKTRRIWQI
jgi:hypothetical protein